MKTFHKKNLQINIPQKKNYSKLSPGIEIYLGLGANKPGPAGMPHITLRAVLQGMNAHSASAGVKLLACSHFYHAEAIGKNMGGDFINAVAVCHASCRPEVLLARLKRLERIHGRHDRYGGASLTGARSLDLDILDYGGQITNGACVLPHPRMMTRRFVLAPLAALAPCWRHPVSGAPIGRLLAKSAGRVAVFSLRHRGKSRKNKKSFKKRSRTWPA